MNEDRDKQIADAVINARQHDNESLAIDHAAYIVGQYRLEIESAIRAEALRDAADRAVVYAMTRTAVWPEELRAAILAGEVKE